MKGFSINKPFIHAVEAAARQEDASAGNACGKIIGKLEEFARKRGLKPEGLCLLDVCATSGDLHPRLLKFIDDLPKKDGQPNERYKKYKEEITANIRRAISIVVAKITGKKSREYNLGKPNRIPLIVRPETPALAEIYDLMPRELQIGVKGETKFRRGEHLTENGLLFYLACEDVFISQSVSTPQELLTRHETLLRKTITDNCPIEQISKVRGMVRKVMHHFGISKKAVRWITVEDFPNPLREELRVFEDAIEGKLKKGVVERAASLEIRIQDRIRKQTYQTLERNLQWMLTKLPKYNTLSVSDILFTAKTIVTNESGDDEVIYYNKFLTPIREAEMARETKAKRAGYDSVIFETLIRGLKSLAAYNGIFEHHKKIEGAFKIRLDNRRVEERKEFKKAALNRHTLDDWIEGGGPVFEQIIKKGLFKRDRDRSNNPELNRGRRTHKDTDWTMGFVLYYVKFVVMKIMGYRQRQLRDCVFGVNIKATATTIEFSFSREQTKKEKPLHFTADLRTADLTHARLIHTVWLYAKHVYPYIQANLAPWQTGNEALDQDLDPRGQFFVHKSTRGQFKRFNSACEFGTFFKSETITYLKDPELSKAALLMMHGHFLRGAAMDTQMIDNGMEATASSRYFGTTIQTINRKYKDKHAVQDASRDVVLLNVQLKELHALTSGKNESAQTEQIKKLYEDLLASLHREVSRLEESLAEASASREADHAEKASLRLENEQLRKEKEAITDGNK